MKTHLLLAVVAVSLLLGCERQPITEAEKQARENAAKERIERQETEKSKREDQERLAENMAWFWDHRDRISLTITNMRLGTVNRQTPTVRFGGFLANKTSERIGTIVVKVSILNPRQNDRLVMSESIAFDVDVFPTASIGLDSEFEVPGSEMAKAIQQIGEWTFTTEFVTAVPHGDRPIWLFPEVAAHCGIRIGPE